MPVLMQNEVDGPEGIGFDQLQHIAERLLEILGLSDSELSVLVTDDSSMRAINLQHRSIDAPTDVLSFPQLEPEGDEPLTVQQLQGQLLGDIVLSVDTIRRQAEERGVPPLDEAVFLLTHGLLHLMGYDHATAEEEVLMTQRTRELVDRERAHRP